MSDNNVPVEGNPDEMPKGCGVLSLVVIALGLVLLGIGLAGLFPG